MKSLKKILKLHSKKIKKILPTKADSFSNQLIDKIEDKIDNQTILIQDLLHSIEINNISGQRQILDFQRFFCENMTSQNSILKTIATEVSLLRYFFKILRKIRFHKLTKSRTEILNQRLLLEAKTVNMASTHNVTHRKNCSTNSLKTIPEIPEEQHLGILKA